MFDHKTGYETISGVAGHKTPEGFWDIKAAMSMLPMSSEWVAVFRREVRNGNAEGKTRS